MAVTSLHDRMPPGTDKQPQSIPSQPTQAKQNPRMQDGSTPSKDCLGTHHFEPNIIVLLKFVAPPYQLVYKQHYELHAKKPSSIIRPEGTGLSISQTKTGSQELLTKYHEHFGSRSHLATLQHRYTQKKSEELTNVPMALR